MTEKLKTLMDSATDVEFTAPDLAAITADGDRALRRRGRGVMIVAGAAVIALTCGAVALMRATDDTGRDRMAGAPKGAPVDVLTWVEGDTLHTPTASYDLGHRVEQYVRTAAGYAFIGDDDAVFSYVDGEVKEVEGGLAGEVGLLADSDSSQVGWVDRSSPQPVFVVHDLATGKTSRYDEFTDERMNGAEPPDLALFLAIDDGKAYWMDRRGLVVTDLDTGVARVLEGPDRAFWLSDTESGMLVRLVETPTGGDLGSEVVDEDLNPVLALRRGRYFGGLSSDGRWITTQSGTVMEVRTGKEIPLQADGADGAGGNDAVAYEWLDADTVAVFQEGRGETLQLLTCEVPAGSCEVTFDDLPAPEQFQIPGGFNRLG